MQELAPDFELAEELKPPEVFVEIEDRGLKIMVFGHNPQ